MEEKLPKAFVSPIGCWDPIVDDVGLLIFAIMSLRHLSKECSGFSVSIVYL